MAKQAHKSAVLWNFWKTVSMIAPIQARRGPVEVGTQRPLAPASFTRDRCNLGDFEKGTARASAW